jgi:hypothetical protein
MPRIVAARVGTPALLIVLAAPALAHGGARQIHGGPVLGGFLDIDPRAGAGGLVGVNGGYGINDAFRVYVNAAYGLGAGFEAAHSPQQIGTVSAGLAYALDVVSVMPWFGIGPQALLVAAPDGPRIAVAAEGRLGVDFLTSRYFGVTVQAAYGFVLYPRPQVGDQITALVGLRWVADL